MIVIDQPNIFEVHIEGRPEPRPGGVRHEVLVEGDDIRIREVWYFCDTGEEHQAHEVRMPVTSLVHMVLNSTEAERVLLSEVRTEAPGAAWRPVPAPDVSFRDDIAALARDFAAGPPYFAACSLAAGSATEDRNIERWRLQLTTRAEIAMRRRDATLDGALIASTIASKLETARWVHR